MAVTRGPYPAIGSAWNRPPIPPAECTGGLAQRSRSEARPPPVPPKPEQSAPSRPGDQSGSGVAAVQPQLLLDRPHLDGPEPRRRPARCQLHRFVTVPGLDHEESADLLLGLREGAIGDRQLAA